MTFAAAASRDFENLYRTIHADEFPAAARWFEGLEDLILHLEHSPRMGALTHENRGLRQMVHGNKPHFYRVIYKIDDCAQAVTIMQIRHGRRRPFTERREQ